MLPKIQRESNMSIAKIIELISEGESIDAAVKNAVTEASKSVKNIRQVNIEHVEGLVENNKISKFRVNCKISFIVENGK